MLKNKFENIITNGNINEDDQDWLRCIFDRMEKAEAKVRNFEKTAGDIGWELENFRQQQRDNFHGDGQW